MSRQNSHIFSLKKTSIIRTLSNTGWTDTKSRPQRVNLYKLKPLYYGHCGDQVNAESQSGESAQGKSRLVWWAMQGDIKPSRCETTICERCTEEHNRLFEGFNNYRQHKDLFYYILYSSYCLLHLQNSERRFQNCALRYNFLHAALRCSLFRFKTVICL